MLARKPDSRSYDRSAIRDMLGDHAEAASLIEWAAGVALADGGSVMIDMCFGSHAVLLRAVDLGEGRLVRLRIDPEPRLGGT